MQHSHIRSFVRRKGRFRATQHPRASHYLPDYLLPMEKVHWQTCLFSPSHPPVILDVGFGMGHALVEMAQANPQHHYIGIEVHEAGIATLAAMLHINQIQNVQIAPDDAYLILSTLLPPNTIHGVQLFFPDPWPKKRHHKRRLVQAPFIDLVVQCLQPHGWLHIATDWEDYATHCLTVLNTHPALQNQSQNGTFIPRPSNRPLTKFERKGQQLGHAIFDMLFIKK